MRILGISPLDKDATVSFLEDGRVAFACAEERLSRVKMQNGFPHRALQLGLQRTGWDPATVDAVAYAFFDADQEAALIRDGYAEDARAHTADATAPSLARLRDVRRSGYHVDRSVSIPGFVTERDEYMPAKSWLKRLVYDCIGRSARLDWMAHKLAFRRWVRAAVADHARWAREPQAGLAQYG